jgi:HTH-type transcriptional regulator/antitoxin HigA
MASAQLTTPRTVPRSSPRSSQRAAPRLDFSTPHVLRNAREYRAAVTEVDQLVDAEPRRGSIAYDRLEFLSVLIEAYEDAHDPFDDSAGTPQRAVAFMLEQRGLSRVDLHQAMGGKTRVSEFFSGKRPLSIGQVRALHRELGIPADLLIR